MREMLAILLKKEGLDVRSAGSRAEAADALRRGPVDLVLTDVKLPDGDGLEILRHVKAASPETAVIVMTAYGTTETAVAARKLGAEAYILKPFDVDELRIVVRDALANREPARGERPAQARGRPGLRPRPRDRRLAGRWPRSSRWCGRSRPTSSTVLDHRRERHRQGAGGAGDPRALGPRRGAVRHHQLRGAARDAARERAVRPHEGRLHRRAPEQEGAVRGGARRHAVPRRDRRDVARRCRSSCCGRCRSGGSGAWAAPRRSTSTCGSSPPRTRRSRTLVRAEALPRGPLLPPERHPDPHAAAARAARGHPAPRRALPRALRAADGQARREDLRGGDGAAQALLLAGQRARARERDRARGGPRDDGGGAAGAAARPIRAPGPPRAACRRSGTASAWTRTCSPSRRGSCARPWTRRGDRAEAARLLGVSPRSLRYLLGKHGRRADKN